MEPPRPPDEVSPADAPRPLEPVAHADTERLILDGTRLEAAASHLAAFADRWAKNDGSGRSRPAEHLAAEIRVLVEEVETAHAQLRRQTVELTEARAALDAERSGFRALFEVAREGYIVTDFSGVIREFNHGAAVLLNVPAEYLAGKPLIAFASEAAHSKFRVRLYRARTRAEPQEWESTIKPRDLPAINVAITLTPIRGETGTPESARWLIRDVSGSRAEVVATREHATIMRAALDALSAHVAVLDAEGRIVTVNRAWQDAGMPAGLFSSGPRAGANYLELCDAALSEGRAGAAAVRSAVSSVLEGEQSRADVAYAVNVGPTDDVLAAGGSWFSLRVARCDGPDPVNLVVTHEDITAERQQYARERAFLQERAARSAAEAANRAKSEFLATLSHELRTPLNAIAGYAQLLEMGVRGPITPHQAEDLRRILRSERHLLGLINELLNFSRLERGGVEIEATHVRLRDAINEVLELVEPQAEARVLGLSMDCPDPDVAALADREKLRQVLLNVLSNALKFTPAGGHIRIDCSGNGTLAYIRVHDTGIGIPKARLNEIFDPFVQVHRAIGGASEGIGLGLAISRTLARAMGGDLTAKSDVGKGATFELSLPRVTDDATLT